MAGTVFTFEPATYSTGAVEGQDGWYNPLTDAGGFVSLNNGTQVTSNPTGGTQFAAMINNEGTNARTEHLFDFSSASTWTVSYDILLKNFNATDSENTAGSFSLQNASGGTYGFLAALGWMNEGVPASAWAAVYYVANSGGTAGQQIAWMNLEQDHWYRQTTVFDTSTKRILSASLAALPLWRRR